MASSSHSQPPQKKAKQGAGRNDPWFSGINRDLREPAFINRSFGLTRYVKFAWLRKEQFPFVEDLEFQNLKRFLEFETHYYPRLVRQFYQNFTKLDGEYHTMVRGHHFVIKPADLSMLFGLENKGTFIGDTECLDLDVDTNKIYTDLLRTGESWGDRTTRNVSPLHAVDRVLMYIVSYCLIPKCNQNYAQLGDDDLILFHGIKKRYEMNWNKMFLARMEAAAQSPPTQFLPYPMHVTKIMRYYRVPIPDDEPAEKEKKNNWCLNDSHISYMKIAWHRDSRTWLWKSQIKEMAEAAKAARASGSRKRTLLGDRAGASSSAPPSSSDPMDTDRVEDYIDLDNLGTPFDAQAAHDSLVEHINAQFTQLEMRQDVKNIAMEHRLMDYMSGLFSHHFPPPPPDS